MILTTTEFAASTYALLLGLKIKQSDDKEAQQAIQEILDTAPSDIKNRGRSIFGQIIERDAALT